MGTPVVFSSLIYGIGILINTAVFHYFFWEFRKRKPDALKKTLSIVVFFGLSAFLWFVLFPRLGFLIFGV